MKYDTETEKWFREIGHWNTETTVCKCENCSLFYKPQLGHKCLKDKVREGKAYGVEVINRGNCMLCGKKLTEGLFFCKECEAKADEGEEE